MKKYLVIVLVISMFAIVSGGLEILGDDNDKVIDIAPDITTSTTTTIIGGNLTNFTSLTDTPSSYSGADDLCLIVNETSGQVEFRSCAGAAGDITEVLTSLTRYLSGGATSGSVSLDFNETELNETIRRTGLLMGFNSTFNSSYDAHVEDNRSWNQSLADTLYAPLGGGGGSNDGLFVNYTLTTTTGNITNGSLNGYPAANAICDIEVATGSHMCTAGEILNTINNNVTNANFTATFRVSELAPGFLAEANDCNGWTLADGTALGSIFVGSTTFTNTYGTGSLVACNANRAIGCCL